MNLFQILDDVINCDGAVLTLVGGVKFVIELVRWIVPIILIALGTKDIFKAMTSGKDDEQKKAWGAFGKRVIFALAIFLIPLIVSLAFSLLAKAFPNETGNGNFLECYNKAKAGNS